MIRFLRHLWDGPVRTRAFALIVFSAVAKAALLWGVDLSQYEGAVMMVLDFLVLVGVLDATRGTTEVDPIDKAWSIETLAERQAERDGLDTVFDHEA